MANAYAALEELIRERLENWPAQREGYHWPGYTYDHTLRVVNLATHMAEVLRADVEVVKHAALLHDICKAAGRDHAKVGAEEVRRILPEYGINGEFGQKIVYAIECHSGDNTPLHPLENLCLGDADLTDANFGLVATWRFITIRSGRGESLESTIEAMDEWLPRKDELMSLLNTDLGRIIAMKRSAHMRQFCGDIQKALRTGDDSDGMLWLAEYIDRNAEVGRMQAQLAELQERKCECSGALRDTLWHMEQEIAGQE